MCVSEVFIQYMIDDIVVDTQTWTVALGIQERPTKVRSSQERLFPHVTPIATGTRTRVPTRMTERARGIMAVSIAEKSMEAPITLKSKGCAMFAQRFAMSCSTSWDH